MFDRDEVVGEGQEGMLEESLMTTCNVSRQIAKTLQPLHVFII